MTKHVHGSSSLIDMGAVLMGNKQHDVALPINKSKIRSYDLREKKFWLPRFQTNDNAQALMASFHKCLEQSYRNYLRYGKQEFQSYQCKEKYQSLSDFVVCTDYETIKKELGKVQRFCLKFWVLHPWLNHKDAYE